MAGLLLFRPEHMGARLSRMLTFSFLGGRKLKYV